MSKDIVKTLLNIMTPEQKAELMSKLQDPDLPLDNTAYAQKGERVRLKEHSKPLKDKAVETNDFAMIKDKPKSNSTKVEVKQRANLFSDDGTEHKDEANKTPEIIPTNRSRAKFKKVKQVCGHCKKSEMVHPQFVREFYSCAKCAGGGIKR